MAPWPSENRLPHQRAQSERGVRALADRARGHQCPGEGAGAPKGWDAEGAGAEAGGAEGGGAKGTGAEGVGPNRNERENTCTDPYNIQPPSTMTTSDGTATRAPRNSSSSRPGCFRSAITRLEIQGSDAHIQP